MMTTSDEKKSQYIARQFLPAIYLIWAGLILGVSFIATPVKFEAPRLSLAVALEVGKVTFHLFNFIEWCVLALIIALTFISSNIAKKWLMVSLLTAVLLFQTFWLLPILDVRADIVIAGRVPDPAHYHWIYVAAETIKLVLSLSAAWLLLERKDRA